MHNAQWLQCAQRPVDYMCCREICCCQAHCNARRHGNAPQGKEHASELDVIGMITRFWLWTCLSVRWARTSSLGLNSWVPHLTHRIIWLTTVQLKCDNDCPWTSLLLLWVSHTGLATHLFEYQVKWFGRRWALQCTATCTCIYLKHICIYSCTFAAN